MIDEMFHILVNELSILLPDLGALLKGSANTLHPDKKPPNALQITIPDDCMGLKFYININPDFPKYFTDESPGQNCYGYMVLELFPAGITPSTAWRNDPRRHYALRHGAYLLDY